MAVQLVLLASFFLQFSVNPYSSTELNTMEVRAILVADVTIYCGLFYLTDELSQTSSWLLFACIVALNVLFLAYWIAVSLRYVVNLAFNLLPGLGRLLHVDRNQVDEYMEELISKSTMKSGSFDVKNMQAAYKRLLHPRMC